MTTKKIMSTQEVAEQFHVLAQQEKWFEIQDMLFAEDVRSEEPSNSPFLYNANGKVPVRNKGEQWVRRVTTAHRLHTTPPVVGGNFFAVGREVDITVDGHGRIQINQIMMYEVKNGEIVLERFFY